MKFILDIFEIVQMHSILTSETKMKQKHIFIFLLLFGHTVSNNAYSIHHKTFSLTHFELENSIL